MAGTVAAQVDLAAFFEQLKTLLGVVGLVVNLPVALGQVVMTVVLDKAIHIRQAIVQKQAQLVREGPLL